MHGITQMRNWFTHWTRRGEVVKRSLTPLRLPQCIYPVKLLCKYKNVPTRHFRLFCVGTFCCSEMRLPQKLRLLPHFYHVREIRKTRKTRKSSLPDADQDAPPNEKISHLVAKMAYFRVFSVIKTKKNSSLRISQAAVKWSR